jgi:hypothetical protein
MTLMWGWPSALPLSGAEELDRDTPEQPVARPFPAPAERRGRCRERHEALADLAAGQPIAKARRPSSHEARAGRHKKARVQPSFAHYRLVAGLAGH